MSLALSAGPIVHALFNGNKVELMQEGLHAALTECGWSSEFITDGRRYSAASPQSLAVKLDIVDNGTAVIGSKNLKLQFRSVDGLRLGSLHYLAEQPGRTYQIVCNQCQLFVSVPGLALPGSFDANTMCGGVPFIPKDLLADCAADAGPGVANEAWWSCGDSPGDSPNFRRSYRTHKGGASPSVSACYNGDLMSSPVAAYTSRAYLRVLPLTLTGVVDVFDVFVFPRTRFIDGTPLLLPPLLAWGSGLAFESIARVKGLIWDAAMFSEDRPLDLVETIDGIDFINFMHDTAPAGPLSADPNRTGRETFFSSLYLMRGRPVIIEDSGHYAY